MHSGTVERVHLSTDLLSRIVRVSPLVPATEPQHSAMGITHAYRACTRKLVREEARGCLHVKLPRKLRVLNEN